MDSSLSTFFKCHINSIGTAVSLSLTHFSHRMFEMLTLQLHFQALLQSR